MPASQVHPMSAAPTNQVIPREVVVQWEREADASVPSREGFDSPSWRAYSDLPHVHIGNIHVFGWNICLPVALLHLPFCCYTDNGGSSCSLAFTQTVCCGWHRSYLCCSASAAEDGDLSYHDWLHAHWGISHTMPTDRSRSNRPVASYRSWRLLAMGPTSRRVLPPAHWGTSHPMTTGSGGRW